MEPETQTCCRQKGSFPKKRTDCERDHDRKSCYMDCNSNSGCMVGVIVKLHHICIKLLILTEMGWDSTGATKKGKYKNIFFIYTQIENSGQAVDKLDNTFLHCVESRAHFCLLHVSPHWLLQELLKCYSTNM